MEGSVAYLGRYDECINALRTVNGPSKDDHSIKGQYCSLIVRPVLPTRPKFKTICNRIPVEQGLFEPDTMFDWLSKKAHYFYYVPIRIGLCSPSSCQPREVLKVSQQLLKSVNLNVDLVGDYCDTAGDVQANSVQIIVILTFALFFAFLLLATAADVAGIEYKGQQVDINQSDQDLTKASTSSITSSEASVKSSDSMGRSQAAESANNLGHIHGIRVLTMAWIILGHTFGLVNHTNYTQSFSSENLYTNVLFQALLNATVCVDTFFFLSGLLAFYVTWKKVQGGWKLNPVKYIIFRYLRLTPPYLATIGLALLLPLAGRGPLWKETVNAASDSCYTYWWTNILYVNNLIKTEKIFHIIGLLVLAFLQRSQICAFVFMALLSAASTIFSAYQVSRNDYPPTIVSTSPATPERWQFILDFYYKPWPHLPSYFVGMIVGYLLTLNQKMNLSKPQKFLLTSFSIASTSIALYGVDPWNKGQTVSPTFSVLYASTFRTLWTINCGIFVYFLAQHQKGSIYKFLAWKGFSPISRLTFMAYLIHPFVIWFHYGSTREPITGATYPMFHNFLAFYFLTYILALIFGAFFESPFVSLTKVLFEKGKKSPDLNAADPAVTKLFSKSSKVEFPVSYEQLRVIVRKETI